MKYPYLTLRLTFLFARRVKIDLIINHVTYGISKWFVTLIYNGLTVLNNYTACLSHRVSSAAWRCNQAPTVFRAAEEAAGYCGYVAAEQTQK